MLNAVLVIYYVNLSSTVSVYDGATLKRGEPQYKDPQSYSVHEALAMMLGLPAACR